MSTEDDGLTFQEGKQLLGGPSEVAANEADMIFGSVVEVAEAIGMRVIQIDENTDFSQLPPFDELFPEPPVVHPFDSAQTVQLDQGERPLLILAMEDFLYNHEDSFFWREADLARADYNVFRDVYRQMLRLYYAFTGRDFFGAHGFITNFSGRK